MSINMEVKKHAMQQLQDGSWKLTLTIHPEDMPVDLLQAPMGTPYGLAMVKIDYDNPTQSNNELSKNEKSEGEKLRVRAVMLAKDGDFQLFAEYACGRNQTEEGAKDAICSNCKIYSRSELTTNVEAQRLFRELIVRFNDWKAEQSYSWKAEQSYSENLAREYV